MTAFNAVRFRVKPGREQEFLDGHRSVKADWPGLKRANMIKTGERTYCIIAEWTDLDALAAARPHMVASLDTFRATLEDLGGGLGIGAGRPGTEVAEFQKPEAPRPNRIARAAMPASMPPMRRCPRTGAGLLDEFPSPARLPTHVPAADSSKPTSSPGPNIAPFWRNVPSLAFVAYWHSGELWKAR
jgi:Antibiotic biosynthesis monooxygenase